MYLRVWICRLVFICHICLIVSVKYIRFVLVAALVIIDIKIFIYVSANLLLSTFQNISFITVIDTIYFSTLFHNYIAVYSTVALVAIILSNVCFCVQQNMVKVLLNGWQAITCRIANKAKSSKWWIRCVTLLLFLKLLLVVVIDCLYIYVSRHKSIIVTMSALLHLRCINNRLIILT